MTRWLAALLVIASSSSYGACNEAMMLRPQPFLGTAEEIIVLSDGSVWKDVSYKYLYLYAYSPMVIICSSGKMILDHGGQLHEFTLIRIK